MGAHSRRRRGVPVRLVLASGAVLVVTAAGACALLSADFGDVAGAAPSRALVEVSSITVSRDPVGVLDVEPHADLPGVTRPLPLAIPVNEPPDRAALTPGVDERVPVSVDWLASWEDARERAENARWLADSAGDRDEEWMRQRGLLCDPSIPTDPAIAHLCDD